MKGESRTDVGAELLLKLGMRHGGSYTLSGAGIVGVYGR